MSKVFVASTIVSLLLLIQGCSNSFKLRENVVLAPAYASLYLDGIPNADDFKTTFTNALIEAGGNVVLSTDQPTSTLRFFKFEEGRRVIAYSSDRSAREYLVFLKIEYSIQQKQNQSDNSAELPKWRINIDRSYLYDPEFALGKAEEEKRVKQALYEEAARLILLRLKYSESS